MLLAAAIASTALCDDGDFQYQGQLMPGQLLEIRGIFSPIHAQGSADSTVSITAHKTGHASDPASVNIQVVPYDGGLVVCAVYPDADPNRPNTCNPPGMDNYTSVRDNDVQVEFTITVPLGVRLTARTLEGDMQATSLTADVDVSTLRGAIMISTSGGAQATTQRGSITASIGKVAWTGLRFFDTGDGNLDLQIPADSNVSVRASAFDGTVTSDFPLMTRSTSFGLFSLAYGTVGDGGRTLLLSTRDGNITLHKGPASGM